MSFLIHVLISFSRAASSLILLLILQKVTFYQLLKLTKLFSIISLIKADYFRLLKLSKLLQLLQLSRIIKPTPNYIQFITSNKVYF